MRRFMLLGWAGLALAIGVPSVHAEPPLDAKAAEEQRLRKFWQDYSSALRHYQGASQDAAAKAAAHPEGAPCRH